MSPEERRDVIRQHGKKFDLKLLIETGSADGDTPLALEADFDRIITIEISAAKYYGVWGRLLNYPHILPLHGDSAEVIPHLLNNLNEPALFWLDGHYNGEVDRGPVDTPIRDELRWIFSFKREKPNVILIDDARLFGTDIAYPTIGWIEDAVGQWVLEYGWPEYSVKVLDDIIRILPV